MDWVLAVRQERVALQRIVTLLLALADLAEHACSRSPAVCAFVVWILRPAETAAATYLGVAADVTRAPFVRVGDARTDAIQLASRFRLLAHAMIREGELALGVPGGAVSRTDVATIPEHADESAKRRASPRCEIHRVLRSRGPPPAPDTS